MLKYDRATKRFYTMSAGRRVNLPSHRLLIKYIKDNKWNFWYNKQGETCAVDVVLPEQILTVPVLEILKDSYDNFVKELNVEGIEYKITNNDKFTRIIIENNSGVLFKLI